jgi:hypothetical protein
MASRERIPDADARIVQLAFDGKQCAVHVVRGNARWRKCIRCGVLIMRDDDADTTGP